MRILSIWFWGIVCLWTTPIMAQPGIMIQRIKLDTLSKKTANKIKESTRSYIHYIVRIDSASDLDDLVHLEGFEDLSLEIGLSSVPERFRSFDMRHCKTLSISGSSLQLRELSALDAFPNLERLHISHFAGKSLPIELGSLKKLSSLYISNAPKLEEVAVIGGMPNIEQFVLGGVPAIRKFPSLAPNNQLTELNLNLSDSCNLEALTTAKKLQVLSIHGSNLRSFPETAFSNLKNVTLYNCNNLQSIAGLAKSTKLEWITLYHTSIKEIEGDFSTLQLKRLELKDNPLLKSTLGLSSLTKVEELLINNSPQLEELGPDTWRANIQSIYLTNLPQLKNIGPLSGLTNLRQLNLNHTGIVAMPAHLNRIQTLNLLYLYDNLDLRDIEGINNMLYLSHLHISNSPLLRAIPQSFASNQSLESAKFDLSNLENINGLVGLSALSSLHLKFELESFQLPIDFYQTYQLNSLTLEGPIRDINPLLSFSSLNAIILDGDQLNRWPKGFYPDFIKISNSNISDLSDLDCSSINHLQIIDNLKLKRVPERESLYKISHLYIRRNPKLKIPSQKKSYHWVISENEEP